MRKIITSRKKIFLLLMLILLSSSIYAASNVPAALESKLIFEYQLGDGTDATGNTSLDLTMQGTVVFESSGCVIADCALFSTGNYLYSNSFFDTDAYDSGITSAFWGKTNNSAANQNFFGWDEAGSNGRFQMFTQTTGGFYSQMHSGTDLIYASADSLNNTWIFYTVVHNTSHNTLYLNGVQVLQEVDIAWTNGAPTFAMGIDPTKTTRQLSGYIDEATTFKDDLTAAEVLSLYNNYLAPAPAGADSAYFVVPPSIPNGTTNNTQVNITFNSTSGYADFYFENVNPPTVQYFNNVSTGTHGYTWTTNVTASSDYYFVACVAGNCSLNSSTYIWTFDNTTPTITLNPNNGFNSSNFTLDPFSSSLQLNITFQDNNMVAEVLINITHTNGTSFYSFVNNSVDIASYNFTALIDVSSWPAANYSTELSEADGHTLKKIGDYDVSKPFGGGKLLFDTPEGNSIRIESDLLSSVETTKEIDRYKFSFDFLGDTSTSRTFHVKSDGAPIRYVRNSKYKAHFIVGGAHGGNWIDFEGIDGKPTITKIDDHHYTVTFDLVPDKVTFNSIGSLNTVTEFYEFEHNTLTIDSVDISPTIPIQLDDLEGSVTATAGQNNTINFSWRWYANDTLYSSGNGTGLTGTTNLANISSAVTTLGSNWTFSAIANVEDNYTLWVNSSTVVIYPQALNISIYDEDTLALITENVTILVSSDSYERTQYTDTGQANIANLDTGEHSFRLSAENYSTRTYLVTLTNASEALSTYLARDASELTLTVKDRRNGAFIESALSTQYRIINNAWVPVESKYTDITGRIVFSYLSGAKYRFIIAKSGFETNTFELDPVVFSEYDVYLTPTSSVNATFDYDRIAILYSPQIFPEGENTFLWVITSPYGELEDYGYTLYFPGGNTAASGTSTQGEQLNSSFNISGATFADRVQMDMYYTSTVGGFKNFTLYFPILINSSQQGTMEKNRDNHYGLGILERILIMLFTIIGVVGIATLIGRPLEGMALGLLLMGWYVYIGFISYWAVIVSIIAGSIILAARSSD